MFALFYRIYRTKIFPKVKNLRGSTWFSRFLANLASLSLKRYPYPSYTILDFKWDVLIILDACRYDLFCKYLGKKCNFILSVGSHTQEWFLNTFKGKVLKDIIYISGNPFISNYKVKKMLKYNPFFLIEDVWKYGWDKKIGTTPPAEITKAAVKLFKKFPEKRFIVHYVQPHFPYIGRKRLGFRIKGSKGEFYIERGTIDRNLLVEAYLSNLELVMQEVRKICKVAKRKKVVITSDHGEHLGENYIYFHLPKVRTEELVKVPWYEL